MKKFLSFFVASCLFLTGCSAVSVSFDTSPSVSPSSTSGVSTVAPPDSQSSSADSFTQKEVEKEYPSSNVDYYTNVDGNEVQSPTYYPSQPEGASARCGDGSYSFSQHRQGTCSHHGGVDEWL